MTDAVDFVNKVAAAQAGDARDALNDMLSNRAMQALDGRKQEIAQSLFNGVETEAEVEEPSADEINQVDQVEVEVQDAADAPVEEPVEEPTEDE